MRKRLWPGDATLRELHGFVDVILYVTVSGRSSSAAGSATIYIAASESGDGEIVSAVDSTLMLCERKIS